VKRSRILSAAGVASLLVAPLFVLSPAHATVIDVAGQQLNFGNAVDENILENADINDSYLYENVVTVGGVEVDALVTVTFFSDNSIGNYPHESISDDDVVLLNSFNTEHVDVAGCYTTEEYVATYYAEEAYDFLGFNEEFALRGGYEVAVIDMYEDDPEWEHTISTGLVLCDYNETDEVDGSVDINVAFEVDGAPVTLTNVAISAHDIDNNQMVTFGDPAPTTFSTSGDDSLVTIQDMSEIENYITFTGPDDDSEDGLEGRYVGEVTYDSVSEFNYSFFLENESRGTLQLEFDSYFNASSDLAPTGVEPATAGFVGLAVLGLGSAMIVARIAHRRRA
jgi:hypothetical protein